ncbi:MAG: hypothetical protein KGL66_08450 [Alphaproteobacteria bacterium]|nr:hypothetical protein [Alphaproteobacteria bacterium]
MEKRDDSRWAIIEHELAITRSKAATTHISMVLNEPGPLGTSTDYSWHSIATEYLDDDEKSELVTGLRDAGFGATVYEGETAFIRAVLDGSWDGVTFSNKYVFSTTGSGTGRARTSLIPSFCDLRQIPLCSADGLTAAILENKFYSFRLLEAFGFSVPRTCLYVPGLGWNGPEPVPGTKVICKPCRECSSIGVDEQSVFAFERARVSLIERMAFAFRQPVLVQEFIAGYEVEVPIFPVPAPVSPAAIGIKIDDDMALGETILTHRNIVDGDYSFYDFSVVDAELAENLKLTAESIYRAFGLTGLVRIDWRITSDGRFYITDFNTPPHLTRHSSCSTAFELGGHKHADLMIGLVTVGRLGLGG